MSEVFESMKLNLERTIQGLKTKESEFIYTDNKSPVPKNKTYSAYYLTDKNKLYFTNLITSNYVRQLIRIKGFDLYEQYTSIKPVEREVYPAIFTPKPTEKNYNSGFIKRYFVKKANDINASVFEISESDYNQNLTLFNKTEIVWTISGMKLTVIRKNLLVLKTQEKIYKGISKMLFPLQYWRPSKDTPVTLEKKLSLLKKT